MFVLENLKQINCLYVFTYHLLEALLYLNVELTASSLSQFRNVYFLVLCYLDDPRVALRKCFRLYCSKHVNLCLMNCTYSPCYHLEQRRCKCRPLSTKVYEKKLSDLVVKVLENFLQTHGHLLTIDFILSVAIDLYKKKEGVNKAIAFHKAFLDYFKK